MDSSFIAAFSAILGTAVGGLITFGTTFLNQRYATRREMLLKEAAHRDQVYSDFFKEVTHLYINSLDRSLDDFAHQTSVVTMYSLLGRIRMISSGAVLTAAEQLADDVFECYKRPPMTIQEFKGLWGPNDAWHQFTDACRTERESMLGRL